MVNLNLSIIIFFIYLLIIPAKMSDPKIVQICHGRIYPPYISAYALRVNNLLPGHDSTIVSTGGMIFRDTFIDNIREYRAILTTVYSVLRGNRYLEIAISRGQFLRRKYIEAVKTIISDSDIVVLEGPWQYYLFRNYFSGKFIVYDAHNVESLLREGNKYHEYTLKLEKDLVSSSNLILSVSKEDVKYLIESFKAENVVLSTHILGNRIFEWNGENSKNIVFIGSIYGPNIKAVNFIISIASELPDFQFSIIGNVNLHRFSHVPGNVKFYGMIGEDEKNKILSSSILALNPVFESGGRNVKMVDYIMHGLPIITTETGTRGFSDYDFNGAIIVDGGNNYVSIIKKITSDKETILAMSRHVIELRSAMLQKEGTVNAGDIILDAYRKWKANQTSK